MERNIALCKGTIYTGQEVLTAKSLLIADGIIQGMVADTAIPAHYLQLDVQGQHICPGLIDLQIYGTGTDLFSAELTADTLLRIDQQLINQGCTSYLITLATNTLSLFQEAIRIHAQAKPQASLGLHLEGPFLNPQKRGAHPEELIIPASKENLMSLWQDFPDQLKMLTIAPEMLDPQLISWLIAQDLVLSAGHSAATYAQAKAAFDLGIPAVTHLWNAMSAFHHRDVGLPGALFSHAKACASIIVDGIHVSYEAVRISKQLLGDRLFLITDAVAACAEGIYQHQLHEDHYVLPDGTLSGSALTLLKAVQNCVEHVGIPLDEALRMATLYPAKIINRLDLGDLQPGTTANVLVFDSDFSVSAVFLAGEQLV